ncbi:MAG: DUF1553 domain-containing protein, partial [Planctomycetes bacterium]|nr:DUF1553 domain-containing protein [Planctomycetota bacterium]
FDLTGLPPTELELDAFLADRRPDAFERVVDSLLASVAFAEHQARHWLDVVRFAETLGHEFDYPIPNAWRYRDYVVRAFHADVGFDQLVREHIAGDLLEVKRRHPTEGFDESILGTGFWWFAEQGHSPVDVRKHTADRVHNQLDVLGKAFLGLTVGCARCHDHKFDAISARDYYALAGYLKSSRYLQRDARASLVSSPAKQLVVERSRLRRAWSARVLAFASDVPRALADALRDGPVSGAAERWRTALRDKAIDRDPHHPAWGLRTFLRNRHGSVAELRERWAKAVARTSRPSARTPIVLADFAVRDYAGWFREGVAFGSGPIHAPLLLESDWFPPAVHAAGWAHSAVHGLTAQGVLHSPTFRIERGYLHVLAHGRESRIRVVLEGFDLIRAPIYGGLKRFVDDTMPRWYTFDLRRFAGQRAFVEFVDQEASDLADDVRGNGYRTGGYLAVRRVVCADDPVPPTFDAGIVATMLGDASPEVSVEPATALASSHARAIAAAADGLARGVLTDEQSRLLDWLWERQWIVPQPTDPQSLAVQRRRVRELDARSVRPMHVPAMSDGTGEDEHVFIRGSHHALGPKVPRRLLTAIGGAAPPAAPVRGSGRLQLAERILAADDPLPARVFVNRLWKHVFGRGLVATVDDFGVQGSPPSHPELLDWLARRFVADGWSTKKAIRRMVLSRTYRMASASTPEGEVRDPNNRWLHRMPVRRLPAESLRDAILSVSGRLDRTLGGAGVPPHLTRFQQAGRGRPRSGPLDGGGRRSLYLRVGRNFLDAFLLAFDFPLPASTMGRRAVTNVPAQALALLNDPFVHGEAGRWAAEVVRSHTTPERRIVAVWRRALLRVPRPAELQQVRAFLADQARVHGCGLDDPRPWQDLCHAVFNLKEFLFRR